MRRVWSDRSCQSRKRALKEKGKVKSCLQINKCEIGHGGEIGGGGDCLPTSVAVRCVARGRLKKLLISMKERPSGEERGKVTLPAVDTNDGRMGKVLKGKGKGIEVTQHRAYGPGNKGSGFK